MTRGWRSTAGSGLPVSTTPSKPMSSVAMSTASSDALGIGAVLLLGRLAPRLLLLLERLLGLGRLLALRRDQMMHLAGEDLLVALDERRCAFADGGQHGLEPVAVGAAEIAQHMAEH